MILPPRLRWLWLTLAVVFLDRASKVWIESRPAGFFPYPRNARYLDIISSRNPGIAFSFMADWDPHLVRIVLIAGSTIIIGLIAWLLVASRNSSALNAVGLALLLGGAAGNLTDRIVHGPVTDFLQVWLRFLPWDTFNPWPTFNVADSAITIGAILIVFDVLFPQQHSLKS
ncbi:MAG: signal peptidase II [Candidatus Acidiferrum sp.]